MTRVVHVVAGGLIALVGAAALVNAVTGLNFLGANGEPGPGFFPAFLAAGLVVLGLALGLNYLLAAPERLAKLEQLKFSRSALLRAGSVWVALAITVALMSTLGFLGSAIVLVAVLVLGLERLRGLRAIAAMVALPIAIYVTFSVLLDVRLPEGVFGG
jgi:putative tricarboxylic transport membrane protein